MEKLTIAGLLQEKVNKNIIFETSFTVMQNTTWGQGMKMISYSMFQHSTVQSIASVITAKISAKKTCMIIHNSAFFCIVPKYSCLNNTVKFYDLH